MPLNRYQRIMRAGRAHERVAPSVVREYYEAGMLVKVLPSTDYGASFDTADFRFYSDVRNNRRLGARRWL